MGRRRSYTPKQLPNDITAATARTFKIRVVRETLGVIATFYVNFILKSRWGTMSKICRHKKWFGKHFEINDADMCSM